MSGPIGVLLFSLLFLGVSLIIFGMAIYAWFSGRILLKGHGWLYRDEAPIAFYACTILFTLIGGAFSVGGGLFVATTVSLAFRF